MDLQEVEIDNVSAHDEQDLNLNSAFSSRFLPVNKASYALVENFIINTQNSLFSFFRRKVLLSYNMIELYQLSSNLKNSNSLFISAINFSSLNVKGFIIYETAFLEKAIHILYGGEENTVFHSQQPIIGKVGTKIGCKISEILIADFKKIFSEKIPLEMQVINNSTDPNIIQKEENLQSLLKLTINTEIDQLQSTITLIFPAIILEENININKISYNSDSTIQKPDHKQLLNLELANSSLVMVTVLPKIQLTVKEIMNLKSGDLISIPDPTSVYLSINDKVIFKGTAGSANNKRVVKINGS